MLSQRVAISRGGGNDEVAESGERDIAWLKWSHADIGENNTASRRICEWLGGKIRWIVVWIRVGVIKGEDDVFRYESRDD
jgi:hypothetical protein